MHRRPLLSTFGSYQRFQKLTPESGHVQTSREVLKCLDQLEHVPSAELAAAARAWAEAAEGSSKALPAVSHASTAATGHYPHFAAEIQARSKLGEVCLWAWFPCIEGCGACCGRIKLSLLHAPCCSCRVHCQKLSKTCVQAHDARQIAEELQGLLTLPQVPLHQPDMALQLLQPLLDASTARLLQLQQSEAVRSPEQSPGMARRAWGLLSGVWKGPQPAAELVDASAEAAEGQQVQPAAQIPVIVLVLTALTYNFVLDQHLACGQAQVTCTCKVCGQSF